MNVIAVTGRLTGQPELKTVGEKQTPKVSFRVAIDNGGDQDPTFVNVEAWGKTAEAVAKFKNQGDEVQVDGTLRSSEWEKEDGTKAYSTYINASHVGFGRNKGDGTPAANEAPAEMANA